MKNKDGKVLKTREEQEDRWIEHFREVLNQPDSDTEADIGDETIGDVSFDEGPITGGSTEGEEKAESK